MSVIIELTNKTNGGFDMSRFELGMSVDYAGSWTVVDAVREFFQNAIDEQKENPENKMSFHYDEESQTLSVGNLMSKLTPKTLLLGCSSKRGKSGLIGTHGEGYKVATVVLVRNGIQVNIYNNEVNEIWRSRIVNSRRYGAEVVCFDIEKKIFNKKENLCIELVGISPEMYNEVVKSNLHLQGDLGEVIETEHGRILNDERYSGDIFVEGLFVCHNDLIDSGYDFNADMIKLDRDRGLVDTFDLKMAIATLYVSMGDSEYLAKNIKKGDLDYVATKLQNAKKFYNEESLANEVSNAVYEDFKKEYGEDAIPVSNTDDFYMYSDSGLKPIMVSANINNIIRVVDRDFYENVVIKDLDEEFENWIAHNKLFIRDEEIEKLRFLWSKK